MFSSHSSSRPARILFALASIAVVCGCDSGNRYPVDLTYHVRDDFIIQAIPKLQPAAFNTPGRMPLDFLTTLPRKYDSSRKVRSFDYDKIEREVKEKRMTLNDNQKALIEESKTNVVDPRSLTAGEKNKIGEVLAKVFGTPANPLVKVKGDDGLGVGAEIVQRLKLDADTLKEGSRLYRQHCLHCHGLEGNGRGPTGYWVNPHPRDYRQGIFKFTSSTQDLGERKPRRDDLMHVLVHGIEGSSMPSFGMYPREDLDKIISYVIHLSMRGEIEVYVMNKWMQESKQPEIPTAEDVQTVNAAMQAEKKSPGDIEKVLKEMREIKPPKPEDEKTALAAMDPMFVEALDGLLPRWVVAQDSPIMPDPYPYPDTEEALLESAKRGAELFTVGTASCVSCHKNYGREAPYYFDAWGTIVRPRNLAEGFYRGGRRPIDMYYRVWSGINGAGMASYDKELRPNDKDKEAKVDRLWDVVNFMQVLHYPELRAKLKDRGVKID